MQIQALHIQFQTHTALQHLVCRAVQSLHINHMQMSIIEVSICRRLHMDTSMIPICIWLVCRLCTTLHTKCCGAVSSLPFYIDASSGSIFVVSPLNYEAQMSYTFVVKVQDGGSYNGSNVLSSTTPVTAVVLNMNENAPQFSNGGIYGAAVPKNASIGTTVLNLQCTDTDTPPYVSISSSGFSGKPFNLTQNNITVSQSPIATGIYTIPLTCSDRGNLSTSGSVFIIVPDPAAPAFTQSIYVWTLPKNTSTGLVYAQVKASSSDQSAFIYTIVYGNSDEKFYIHSPKMGDIILVEQLHYAAQQNYALVVQAQDSSSRQRHALVHVQVLQGPGRCHAHLSYSASSRAGQLGIHLVVFSAQMVPSRMWVAARQCSPS